jgi:hypothetical protein
MDAKSTYITERTVYRLGETLASCGGFTVIYLPTPEDTLSYCVVNPLGRVVRALRTLKAARRAARRLYADAQRVHRERVVG